MLTINFLFILRKSVNFNVIPFSNRKMNSTISNFSAKNYENRLYIDRVEFQNWNDAVVVVWV